MTKKRTQKSKKKGLIGRILFYGVVPIVGSLFMFLVLNSENRFKYKEIAEKLEIPIGTVKSKIFFARQKLMETLPEYKSEYR